MSSHLTFVVALQAALLSPVWVRQPLTVPLAHAQEPCSAAIAVLDRSQRPEEVQWALRSLNSCPRQAAVALEQMWASAPSDPGILVYLAAATSRVRSGALLAELERTARAHDSVNVRGAALGAAFAMVTRRQGLGFERAPSGRLRVTFGYSPTRLTQGSADPLADDAEAHLIALLESRATTEPDYHTRLLIDLLLRELRQ